MQVIVLEKGKKKGQRVSFATWASFPAQLDGQGGRGPLAGSWWTCSALSLLFFSPRHTGCSQEALSPSFPLLPSPTAPMGSATLRRPPPSRSASFLPLSAAHRLPSPPRNFAWCPSLSHLADSGETGCSASRQGRPWWTRGRASAPALSCLLLVKCARAIRSRAWRTRRLGPWVL